MSLKDEYFKKRFREENRALEKMEKDPSYFLKYTRRFGKKEGSIPSLKGPGGLVSDGKAKAQILNKQYSSVWSVLFEPLTNDVITYLFKGCSECSAQTVHECKEDQLSEAILNHREAILEFSRVNNSPTHKEYIIGEL